jgi:LCP family protein required for cell wall assembly
VLASTWILGVVCLVAAGALWWANGQLQQVQRVVVDKTPPPVRLDVDGGGSGGLGLAASVPTTTVAPGALAAKNFLLVGSDSRDCIDPNSPYAGGFVDGSVGGKRSDTIMIIRIEPATSRAAILSFPRDLWVRIDGAGYSSKINSAYDGDDPNRLVRTIKLNFGIPIDHYVDVDFCAFKDLVDAIGGVRIPFAYPTRDLNTGLDVPAGCIAFDGDAALAYARSRYYQYFDGRRWVDDGVSDYGRIARQQDFIRRAVQRALDKGARDPTTAARLLRIGLSRVKVDQDLVLDDLLRLSGALEDLDPTTIRSYRIDGRGELRGGASVVVPAAGSARNRAILAVFTGQARLADSPEEADLPPEQAPSTTTTTVTGRTTTTTVTTTTTTTTTTSVTSESNTSSTSVPKVFVEEKPAGARVGQAKASSGPDGAPSPTVFGYSSRNVAMISSYGRSA